MSASHEEAACDVAHGTAPAPSAGRVLVAVFATPVAGFLLRYGSDAGYRAVLVEPDTERAKASQCDAELAAAVGDYGESADVVVTDHHRPELGIMLRDALASQARWVGIMGNPRHEGPHVAALAGLGSRRRRSAACTGPSASTSARGPRRRSPSRRWPA